MVDGGDKVKLPEFKVTGVHVEDNVKKGTVMSASVELDNSYPVEVEVPELGWRVSLPGCDSELIRVTDAETSTITIVPGETVVVNISSSILSLPEKFLTPCTNTFSPLESFVHSLLNTTLTPPRIYLSGHYPTNPSPSLPPWLPGLLSSLTIPLPLPQLDSNLTDNLQTDIKVRNMKFTLPSPWAPPGTPYSQPKVSGQVDATITLPPEIAQVKVNITALRTDLNLFDEGEQFGRIVIPEWVPAKTTRRETQDGRVNITVTNQVVEVPVEVVDPVIFNRVMRKVLQGEGVVEVGIQGTVDAKVEIQVGKFILRKIPVRTSVAVQGMFPFMEDVDIRLAGDVNVLSTAEEGVQIETTVQVDNPTEMEGSIPYLNVRLLYEG